jgi:hypothetical protein
VLSIPAAIYGLEQTFAGFPSWDRVWIAAHKTSYAAISQNGVPRAFGSFSAASEYATFLAIGVIVWIAFGLRPVLAPIALGAIGTLVVALFYEGSRGSVIATVAALALMTGVRAGVRLKWSLALGAILILVLPYVVTRVVHPNAAGVYSTPFVTRQVEGLQNPTNPTVSTLPSHIKLLKEGLSAARAEPLGRGTGAITIAGAKFGGTGAGTEADPSDVAVAFGLPGLLIYIVIAVECIRRAYRLAFIRRRSWVAPAALAIIVATALQWLNGGQYAVAFLPWLLMGWVDRSLMERPPPPPEPLY